MSETPIESPVEDVAEQRTEVLPDEESTSAAEALARWGGAGWESDPADAQEQDVEVPIDEDEWR
jgi:hypothetical protein